MIDNISEISFEANSVIKQKSAAARNYSPSESVKSAHKSVPTRLRDPNQKNIVDLVDSMRSNKAVKSGPGSKKQINKRRAETPNVAPKRVKGPA